VTTAHLADPQSFDFAGLDARREAAVAALQQAAPGGVDGAAGTATRILSGREPWEEQ